MLIFHKIWSQLICGFNVNTSTQNCAWKFYMNKLELKHICNFDDICIYRKTEILILWRRYVDNAFVLCQENETTLKGFGKMQTQQHILQNQIYFVQSSYLSGELVCSPRTQNTHYLLMCQYVYCTFIFPSHQSVYRLPSIENYSFLFKNE